MRRPAAPVAALRGACLLAACALGLCLPRGAAAQGDTTRELEELQRAIEERRERVEGFERRERGLLDTLERIDRAASLMARAVAREEARARAAREELAQLEQRARELEARRWASQRAMSGRAVALYKAGEVGPLEVIFAAADLRELVTRVQSLRLLLEQDARLLARFRADSRALEAARSEAAAAASARDQALARLAQRSRELAGEREAKRAVMAQVRGQGERERAALAELEAAARALEEKLADLRASPRAPRPQRPGLPFAALRGRLPRPVEAPVARGFGRVVDAQFRTETFRKGVDYAAPFGAAVRAVAQGTVRFAGWFRGYGKLVILDHGEQYFTVSGHLDEIEVEVGDEVAAGQRIGSVGETGSLAGPLLYFEIRRGGEPLDPRDWLAGARGVD